MSATQIGFEYNDTEYTLEFNRKAVQGLERAGFSLDKLSEMPANFIPELFFGAFQMHHSGIKRSLVDEIYEAMGDKEALLRTLIEMYNETLDSLLASSDEKGKNVSWTKK